MGVKVCIDGRVCDEANAKVSVFDRGFLYGDSVYEVMRTAGGRPVDLDRHLDRLGRSADAIALQIPSQDSIRTAIAAALGGAGNDESYIRVVVTRGAGPIGLDIALADRASTIVIVAPLELPARELYERGAHIQIVGVERMSRRSVDPSVKSGNYLNNILALAEARQAGAHEAVMCDATGRIAEGSTSNVFLVHRGKIATPSLHVGLLAGITRQRVIELVTAEGFTVDETELFPDDAHLADEAFITSSIRGVLPVRRIDDVELPAPGPITRRAMELYDAFLAV
jgi:branched-chain amino acid aminotransferase